MIEKYTLEDLKDEEKLIKFLHKIWIDGVRVGMVNYNETVSFIVENGYMPNFKEYIIK